VIGNRARRGRGRSHHVTVHIAARGDGGHQRLIQLLHHLAYFRFHNAVKLEILPGGDAQRVIGKFRRDLIAGDVLRTA